MPMFEYHLSTSVYYAQGGLLLAVKPSVIECCLVCHRIVGQELRGDHRCLVLNAIYRDNVLFQAHLLALSVLSQRDMVFPCLGIVPILTVVDGVVVEQPYEPFARCFVPQA